jgi:hypothetical protein
MSALQHIVSSSYMLHEGIACVVWLDANVCMPRAGSCLACLKPVGLVPSQMPPVSVSQHAGHVCSAAQVQKGAAAAVIAT